MTHLQFLFDEFCIHPRQTFFLPPKISQNLFGDRGLRGMDVELLPGEGGDHGDAAAPL